MISLAAIEVMKTNEDAVVAMTDPKIVKSALRLAYYVAMLDACLDDPMDDPADQESFVQFFRDETHAETELFQRLVNAEL